ncbi:MAG: hypothetical protein QOH13_2421 [Thermoleophilaceae bacterium]|jgi:RNA polymerase sigma-70 factor (ECF subfamily)|nr:hypothetical protein [Thermoleophilaceae bacterium]
MRRHKSGGGRKIGAMAEDMRDDDALIAATPGDPEAFRAFYRRYETAVLRYFLNRRQTPELAADLTAEVFAAVLVAAPRFRQGGPPASAWLFGIARNLLLMSHRRGQVEDRARKRLAMEPVLLTDAALDAIESLGSGELVLALSGLPDDQREAVRARVLDERDYDEIARELRCSQAVVRQRVSRGLRTLRAQVEDSP